MLFRIEDVSGFNDNLRKQDENFESKLLEKSKVDKYIAINIQKEINGSKDRKVLSYSKSLATCLFKYNKYTDNELHIYNEPIVMNSITYYSNDGRIIYEPYSICERLDKRRILYSNNLIKLTNFIIDVSDNKLLEKYLKYYTGIGKKIYVSLEKDNEVIVMTSKNDIIINYYLDSVYVLYALQMRYGFLNDAFIRNSLIMELEDLEDSRFEFCPNERYALILVINYLTCNWNFEYQISQNIYQYVKNKEHVSVYYDSIIQFLDILEYDFDEVFSLKCYNENVVSDLFWKYCSYYLNK